MKTILCIGDSITAGWPYGTSYSYSEYLKDDFMTINLGIPGETTKDIRKRFERNLLSSKADTVLIMAGTNDSMSAFCTVKDSLNNMREMVRTARRYGAVPVILTCLIPDEKAVPGWFEDLGTVRDFLNTYNSQLEEFCRSEQISLIDTRKISPSYTDGVHPDKEGYRMLGTYIANEFSRIIHQTGQI